jgi:methyl-accepting chemotaxis protein
MPARFHLRLTHKIMAIGAVALLGLLAFGAIYQVGSWSQDGSRAIAASAREISDLNQQLRIDLLEAHRNEKDFQLRHTESYAKAHAELVVAIDREFDRLQALTQSAAMNGLSDKVRAAHDGFKSYAADFAALVNAEIRLGLNESLGLSGSLRNAVHDIEDRLKEVDNPRLTSWMLMMRRHEKDYMLRRDPKYAGELKKAAGQFRSVLAAAEIPAAVTAEISQKLEKYQSEFLAWVDTAQKSADYDAGMMKTSHGIEPMISEIGQGIERLYRQAVADEVAVRGSVRNWMLIAFALAFVLACGVSALIGRSISLALSAMVRAMIGLAGGNTAVAIAGLGRHDEIGEMASAVEVFRTNMVEAERMRAEQVDAGQRHVQQRKAEMHKLADAFESAVGSIVETVSSAAGELETSATTLTTAAARSERLASTVAAASEQTSGNVRSVASSSEGLTSSVGEISRQVQESSRVASAAVDQARQTNDRVGELSKAAARIGDVVELINSIAAQTNLLALNATIEAARAGEAGRGFAVVASEVKVLAEQTAKATGEISQQIAGIQAATQESVGAIKEIGDTIGRMSNISSTIAAAVEEQGAATQEIARGVQQAAQGTSEVTSNIADVQHSAVETGSASSQVHSAARALSRESHRLRQEVGKFLDSVRAA